MDIHLFESFSEMIGKIPAKGVLWAVEVQAHMLEDDLANKRLLPIEDARSILTFRGFLNAAASGRQPDFDGLPLRHLNFYRQTVKRLVEGGELPAEAEEQFDATFSSRLLKVLAYRANEY